MGKITDSFQGLRSLAEAFRMVWWLENHRAVLGLLYVIPTVIADDISIAVSTY